MVSIAFLHVNLDFPTILEEVLQLMIAKLSAILPLKYVMGFESAPNFVVDDSNAFCNYTFEIMRFKSAPNFVGNDCKTFCNLIYLILS